MADVRRKGREAEAALIVRNRARDIASVRYDVTATVLEQLCVLAGTDELAERIRPAMRRLARTGTEREEGEPAGGEDPTPKT